MNGHRPPVSPTVTTPTRFVEHCNCPTPLPRKMGCSRPGALAVTCVVVAGALSILSLLLPYWSKMKLEISTQNHGEVTFGLWGACVSLQPTTPTTLDSPVVTNGSVVIAIAPENAASGTITCGSYFDDERVRITCTSFHQLAAGQCSRRDFFADGTLCNPDAAATFLGDSVGPSSVANWLRFLEKACGKTGHTSIVFGVLCSVCTGLAAVLLFLGISCAKIDSIIGKMGAVCTAFTALCQFVIAGLWGVETRVIHGDQVTLGTSFYLNSVSILLHAIAFLAAKKHQSLEAEAQREHLGDDLEDIKCATSANTGNNKASKELDLVAV